MRLRTMRFQIQCSMEEAFAQASVTKASRRRLSAPPAKNGQCNASIFVNFVLIRSRSGIFAKKCGCFSFVVRHKLAPSKTKLSLFPTHRSDIDPTPARPTDLTDQPDRPDRPTRPTQMDERSTQTNGRRKRTVDTDERPTQTNGPHRRTINTDERSTQMTGRHR